MGDFISGLYSNGAERGGNASLDWLMCIVCSYETVKYLNTRGSVKRLALCWVAALYMAAMAEIKLFFLQTVIIAVLAVAICKKSLKIVVFAVAAGIALYFGIQVMYAMFPGFADFFTLENILAYVTRKGGYSSRGHLSGVDRLTAIPYVYKNFLKETTDKIFGIGLGNGDFSSFKFFTSAFYRHYGWSGYSFFSSSFILLELGTAGLLGYLLYYGNYLRQAVRVKTKATNEKSIQYTVMILSMMTFLMFFSNQTMRLEASAYMVTAVLVFPFILRKFSNHDVTDTLIKHKHIKIKLRCQNHGT